MVCSDSHSFSLQPERKNTLLGSAQLDLDLLVAQHVDFYNDDDLWLYIFAVLNLHAGADSNFRSGSGNAKYICLDVS